MLIYTVAALWILVLSALGANLDCGTNYGSYSSMTKYTESSMPTDRSGQDLIIGGDDAVPGAWPAMAVIKYRGYNLCGAVFVQIEGQPAQWLLTAAHCLKVIRKIDKAKVVLGITNSKEQGYTYAIDKLYPHPAFKRSRSCRVKGTVYDIALIKISPKIALQEGKVHWACLPKRDQLKVLQNEALAEGARCHALGFGLYKATSRKAAETLQQLRVHYFPECHKRYPDCYTEKQICWGERGAQSCVGDSGSPLLCRFEGRWTVAGISSRVMGRRCDDGSVYVNVADFMPWIEKTVKSA